MQALHHVGITVKDLDASIRFYHDVLGLPFSNEPSPWFEGPELGPAVGVPGAALRQVSLRLGETTLELLEYKSPASETVTPLPSNNIGASHVAFLVEHIEETMAELEAKGITYFSGVNVVDEGVLAGWRWVYFADPDGYPLELVEVAYYKEKERRAGIESVPRLTLLALSPARRRGSWLRGVRPPRDRPRKRGAAHRREGRPPFAGTGRQGAAHAARRHRAPRRSSEPLPRWPRRSPRSRST